MSFPLPHFTPPDFSLPRFSQAPDAVLVQMCIRDRVRTNADTPTDAKKARSLGAQGIGLCRTEHMFFNDGRIAAIREMICSDTVEQRKAALAKLEPMQQGDFEELYDCLLYTSPVHPGAVPGGWPQ